MERTSTGYNLTGGPLFLAGLLFLFGLSSVLCADDPAVLRQKKEIRVTGQLVPLNRVVRFVSDTNNLKEKLSSLYLGFSPAPGRSRIITRMEIKLELRKKGLRAGEHFSFTGSSRTRVFREAAQRKNSEKSSFLSELEHRLGDYVRHKIGRSEIEVQVDIKEVEYGEGGKPTDERISFQVEARKSVYNGLVPFVVRIATEQEVREKSTPEWGQKVDSDGVKGPEQSFREITVIAGVSIHALVAVASRDLSKGQVVRKSSVTLKRKRLPDGVVPFYKRSHLLRRKLTLDVKKGEIISRSDVKGPVVVHKGDLVRLTILSEGGETHLKMHEALEDGAKGERIKLKGPDGTVRAGVVENAFKVVTGPKILKRYTDSDHSGQKEGD